jgi:hypothetical protein
MNPSAQATVPTQLVFSDRDLLSAERPSRVGQLLVSAGRLNSPAYLFASYAAGAFLLSHMQLKKTRFAPAGLDIRAWRQSPLYGVFSTIEALRQIPPPSSPVTLSGPIILGLGFPASSTGSASGLWDPGVLSHDGHSRPGAADTVIGAYLYFLNY